MAMSEDWLGRYNDALPPSVKPADFSYWSRSPKWSVTEAISLALGADPDSAKYYVRTSYDPSRRRSNNKPPFSMAFEKMRHLVEQNFMSAVDDSMVKAGEYVEWLAQMKLPLPQGLRAAMDMYAQPRIDWRALAANAQTDIAEKGARIAKLETAIADNALVGSSNTKERESLLKLVIGMAVKGYSYDPKAGRSETAKEISDDLLLLGISLSDDTVRKYLKMAADLLPPQE